MQSSVTWQNYSILLLLSYIVVFNGLEIVAYLAKNLSSYGQALFFFLKPLGVNFLVGIWMSVFPFQCCDRRDFVILLEAWIG
jgi:hypothetical protein